ncbi:hypothetical protein GWI33_001049 [Rhynchophorus ferrugineus]|uniref:Uncharacterized protein n=1 Tax=Rhynchophorus ferrugineus TaxID=354439 RepID=A0A834IM41_RHYFE|nr:hypothetical protein GWI33_001049 [Rhynchophorus ferrugineus]
MDVEEKVIQKYLLNFCSMLPSHVELWKKAIEEIQIPLKALSNFTEQLDFVRSAELGKDEHFEKVKEELDVEILISIDEELDILNFKINDFYKYNCDYKNKLTCLEESTLNIDWDSDSPVIKGGPLQPPLQKILKLGFDVYMMYWNVHKVISANLTNLNSIEKKYVDNFVKLCSGEFNRIKEYDKINILLALTQYINKDIYH